MAAAAALALSAPAFGDVYADATGENFDGNAHMDISSVEVTNTATHISFKINVSAASITSPDWGKYTIGFDTVPGGNSNANTNGNGWGRNISMTAGMDYWSGSWVDGPGGVQLFNWDGANWNLTGSPTHLISGNSTTLTFALADLGLAHGSVVNFDVYTTGGNGGDTANDASSNPSPSSAGWGDHYASTLVSTYTVVIPEPASAGLIALGGLALLARRRGQRA